MASSTVTQSKDETIVQSGLGETTNVNSIDVVNSYNLKQSVDDYEKEKADADAETDPVDDEDAADEDALEDEEAEDDLPPA